MGSYLDNVAANLKLIMRERNLTQRDLASIMEVSEPTVSAWMKARKAMRAEQYDKIKERLGISPSRLTRDPDGEDDPIVTFLKEQLSSRGFATYKKSQQKRQP